MNKKTFSEKTQNRLDALKQILSSYEESIQRLNQVAEGRLTLKRKEYSFGAKQYERTRLDEQRLIWALGNLRSQVRFYQHELEALEEYGQ